MKILNDTSLYLSLPIAHSLCKCYSWAEIQSTHHFPYPSMPHVKVAVAITLSSPMTGLSHWKKITPLFHAHKADPRRFTRCCVSHRPRRTKVFWMGVYYPLSRRCGEIETASVYESACPHFKTATRRSLMNSGARWRI